MWGWECIGVPEGVVWEGVEGSSCPQNLFARSGCEWYLERGSGLLLAIAFELGGREDCWPGVEELSRQKRLIVWGKEKKKDAQSPKVKERKERRNLAFS